MTKLSIISGASKGLGKAMAELLLSQGEIVIGLSRSQSIVHKNYKHITFDFSNPEAYNQLEELLLTAIDVETNDVQLINNVGIVDPIKRIEDISFGEIEKANRVNFSSYAFLSSLFIKKFKEKNISKRIINISSGAGRKPYDGWSIYCANKASIDLFSQCVAAEQQRSEYPVSVFSIAPGVVATQMQDQIRESDSQTFSKLQRFLDLKKDDALWSPKFVAKHLFKTLNENSFENGALIDLRDF